MTTLLVYMLKISLSYAIIYLFYLLLLKRLTHYVSNRFFLLIASVSAFFIPFVRLDFFVAPQAINSSSIINSIPTISGNSSSLIFIPAASSGDFMNVLLMLFITGIIICSINFWIRLRSLQKIRASAQFINSFDGIDLCNLNLDIIPFSFGNAIYLNKMLHAENELNEIIKHESVHIKQKHTIDVLVAETVCILNWYNPFVWMIKQAIKQNHEFLADDAVIANGAEKKNYQYLLLKVMGHSPNTLASGLSFSCLKKRIYMINKAKTSKTHLLKFLFVLPVIALMIFAFRDTNSQTEDKNKMHNYPFEETFKLSELSYFIPDPHVAAIVKNDEQKSLLQVGKPFSISLIRDERNRLKSLLEKNGYNNINDHSISFLIDSSSANNSFSVQVNIDLQIKEAIGKSNNGVNKPTSAVIDKSRQANAHAYLNVSEKISTGIALSIFIQTSVA